MWGAMLYSYNHVARGNTGVPIMIIRRFLRLIAIVLVLLSIPFIGMQFSTEVAWSRADFAIAGLGLVGAGIIYEIIRTMLSTSRQRIITGIGIALVVCICWVELAVGVFGTRFSGS